MRILVMGAGAMGSVAGGFMARAGHRVTLVGRAEHMRAVRDHGLHITGIWGEHHVKNMTAQTDVAGLAPGSFDLVLVCVKSYDTRAAMEAVGPLLGDQTLVCSYQNGLGNAEIVAEYAGWPRTVGARAIYGTRITAPGFAEVTVIANPTALGVYRAETPAARVREIAEAMNAAALPTVYTDKIATVLWGKVAYNCALNPLSALLDVPYGVLAETEHTRAIMREVLEELYSVGNAMGVMLEPATAQAYLELFYARLLPPTAAHYASMREDFQRRRKTEIDALNGAIVRYGGEFAAPCPANAMLTRLVKAREYALMGSNERQS